VVGEVKSGKSSLLNALFAQEFCQSGCAAPRRTASIFFRHGPEEKSIEVSPRLTERYLPIALLHDFNVVDTPGTNTMVAEHQSITENFVPRADVVLFIFSVVNPWTQSAWDFLGFVQKKWLKNVVFRFAASRSARPDRGRYHPTASRGHGDAQTWIRPTYLCRLRTQRIASSDDWIGQRRLWRESHFGPLEEQINSIVTETGGRTLKLRSACQKRTGDARRDRARAQSISRSDRARRSAAGARWRYFFKRERIKHCGRWPVFFAGSSKRAATALPRA